MKYLKLYESFITEKKKNNTILYKLSNHSMFRLYAGDLVTKYEGEVSTKESGVVAWITFEDLKQGAFSEYNTKLEQHLKFLNII